MDFITEHINEKNIDDVQNVFGQLGDNMTASLCYRKTSSQKPCFETHFIMESWSPYNPIKREVAIYVGVSLSDSMNLND